MRLTIDMLENMEDTLASAKGEEILLAARVNVPDIQPRDAHQLHGSQSEVSVGYQSRTPEPLPHSVFRPEPRLRWGKRARRTSSAQVTALYVSSPGSVTYTPACAQVLSGRRVLLWVPTSV